MRDTTGRFLPGKSGNPGGRPRVIGHVRDMAQRHADDAISTLAEIMVDSEAPAAARITAACALLDRGYGRPVDQKAMLVLRQETDLLRQVHELPTDQLLEQLVSLAREGALDEQIIDAEMVTSPQG